MPILKPDFVAKKIINAVLTDQVYLLLPKSMYFIAALKKLVFAFSLPHNSTDIMHIYFTQIFCLVILFFLLESDSRSD